MMSRMGALLVAVLAMAAGAAVAENRIGLVVHVTEADAGRSIRVPVGLEIRARLAQPSGTRERWEMRADPHVALIGTPASQVAYGTGMGRGGREFREFRIRVVRPGRFTLNFGMLPPLPSAGQVPSQRIAVDVDAPAYEREDRWRPAPGYDWDGGADEGPDTVEPLNERDAGRQIDVPADRELTIALPSNASTGYHWEALFLTNVRVLGEIEEERSRNARIGAGGTSLVRVRVLRPGRAEITLMYLPPAGGTAERTLTYRLRGV